MPLNAILGAHPSLGRELAVRLSGLESAAAAPAGLVGRLDSVTAELAADHPEWAGVRAMLIRPDGYIAWATHADDEPPLARWLGPA